YVNVARFFTAIFAVLLIVVAVLFAYIKVTNPSVRIIPVVLGIGGIILGPMLGVFLIGMYTRGRGSEIGNILAVTAGMAANIFLVVRNSLGVPVWMPKIEFTWYAMVGAVVVFAVGVLFKTPEAAIEEANRKASQVEGGEDRPMELR